MADLEITINGRIIGQDRSTYVIAEISANHNQEFEEAVKLIHAASEAGADAIKLQTYTPDTMTIDCDNEYFQISKGTIWEGRSLYDLYGEAYTPWDWQPKLQECRAESWTRSRQSRPPWIPAHPWLVLPSLWHVDK